MTGHKVQTIILSVSAILIIVLVGYYFADIIALLSISILISLIFIPIVGFLEQYKIPRLYSVLAVFILTALLFISMVSFLMPKLVSQLNTISQNLNQENIQSAMNQIEVYIQSNLPFLGSINISNRITTLISNVVLGWVDNLSGFIYSLFSILAALVIVPFMTFFILKDSRRISHGIINFIPNKYFEFSYNILNKVLYQLGRYVRGWILDAFLVGLFVSIGLSILGIQNAISIGFIAGVGHLIPYFGPVIGGIPAITISIIQFGDLTMLPAVIVLFVVIYTFDNGFIQPNIFSKSTDMHPLFIIILILAGSQVLGVLGMLLAVPIATIIKTAAKEIYYGYKNYKILHI